MIITDINILKKTSESITRDRAKELKIFERLEAELKASETPGYGLAAIQIGEPYMCFKMMAFKILNPRIISKSEPIVIGGEGCLSFPGQLVNTDRYNQITVQFEDYDTGKFMEAVMYGTEAIVFQHEFDHCAGITIHDREHRTITIGRNDPCPLCIAEGINIKYKKCKKHFKDR